ncbi:hypothetical protein F5B20DRAFT_589388 [Whalleya microplaca]|nr:hypothetical protein F5B20DRAFT_589388 [Whalleya microplaca]
MVPSNIYTRIMEMVIIIILLVSSALSYPTNGTGFHYGHKPSHNCSLHHGYPHHNGTNHTGHHGQGNQEVGYQTIGLIGQEINATISDNNDISGGKAKSPISSPTPVIVHECGASTISFPELGPLAILVTAMLVVVLN